MTVLLSGSLAFDHIMVFPGHFEDHILPEKIHVLNVSFLVDSLDRLRGGVAGNIAYNLSLLKEPCRIIATVGTDFGEYRAVLDSMGVDTSTIAVIDNELTASAFITTDHADNQITGFYPGAMSRARDLSLAQGLDDVRLGVVSPTDPEAMRRHCEEFASAGVPYIFDPGQQIIALSASTLVKGIEHAEVLIGNDYEFAMISEKTGQSREDLLHCCPTVVVTYGELGSTIYHDHGAGEVTIPAVRTARVVDPTGAGDGYRAGFITAMLAGLPWETVGRMASMTATFVVEVKGTQSHSYTFDDFAKRFKEAFPDHAAAFARFAGERVSSLA